MALKRMGIVDNYQRIRDHASRLKAIPTELHSEEAALRRAVAQDDAGTEREHGLEQILFLPSLLGTWRHSYGNSSLLAAEQRE